MQFTVTYDACFGERADNMYLSVSNDFFKIVVKVRLNSIYLVTFFRVLWEHRDNNYYTIFLFFSCLEGNKDAFNIDVFKGFKSALKMKVALMARTLRSF